jgi:hypothetical protein
MGREAIAVCHWRGETAEAKALLEASHIILRGAIRLRVERLAIDAIARDDGELILTIGGERLILELGATEVAKWHDHLLNPVPTLAEKLGVDGTRRAFVIGTHDDAELTRALDGATTGDANEASVVIAILTAEADIAAAVAAARANPARHLWCMSGKGKFATLSDSTIRAALRAHGFVDNKTSGVSDRLTATRYRMKA